MREGAGDEVSSTESDNTAHNFTNCDAPDPGDGGAVLPNNLLFCGEEFVIPNTPNTAADFGKP